MTVTSNRTDLPGDFTEQLRVTPFATAASFYAARLPLHDKATAFVAEELKLTIEQASQFQIGFSDRRLGKNLPSKDSEAGRSLRALLQEIGLFKSTGHERLRGCITVPLYDDTGNITGLLGKRIDRNAKADDITIGEGTMPALVVGPATEPPAQATVTSKEITTKDTKSTKDDPGESSLPSPDCFTIEDNQIVFIRDDRRYRIRGLERNTNPMTVTEKGKGVDTAYYPAPLFVVVLPFPW